jgi:membrane fusion protein, copper/silver efflux system
VPAPARFNPRKETDMRKNFVSMFCVAAAMFFAALPAEAGPRLKLLNTAVASGVVSQLRIQLFDETGKPAKGAVGVAAVRVDMSPDAMADMTADAKILPSKEPGVVVVETNLYAPGRWAVILTVKTGGKTVKDSVIVTANRKTAEAASPPPASVPTAARKILYYRNPMGLADTSPVPKKDAMGMDYIPVYADEVTKIPGAARLTAAKIQRAGVRTATVTRMEMAKTVRADGVVSADENRQGVLTARFDGFIDRLYVAQTGDVVRKGQPLMRVWIQSPDALTKEADYVGAMISHSDVLAAQAAAVLRQYGIAQSDLNAMVKAGVPSRVVTLYAPMAGTVMEKPAVAGMHFSAGDALFKTADVSHLWVLADLSERDLALVTRGQSAAVRFRDDPDASFAGRVLFVYPDLDPVTRTAKVRIAMDNAAGRLRIGQYADVRIDAPVGAAPVLTVPASSIIDDGTRRVVFVALADGVFAPRDVKPGARSGDTVEIRAGLREGERIVTSGNFLIDAESNLEAALQNFSAAGTQR